MEHFFISLLILFFSFISLTLFVLFYKHRSSFSYPNTPPGSIGIPILGETLEFFSTGWKGEPEKFIFDRLTKYKSDIFKTSIVGVPAAIFCGPVCNKFLFSNENKLVTAWWPDSVNKIFPSSTQTSSMEEAKKLKKLLPQFLKPEALQRYIGIMDELAHRHFASSWENKEQVLVFPLAKR